MPDQPDPLNGVDPQHVQFLTAWAAKHGATVTFAGECGFGRECVGVLIGGSYLDYSHLWDLWRDTPDKREQLWWQPGDAYHKHDCMAVLGRGPATVEQLYQWAKFLDEHGWTIGSEARRPDHVLDAMLHSYSTPMLMPPAEERVVSREPDQTLVREIARKHIRSGRTDFGTTIVKHFGDGALGDEEFFAWEHEVAKAWYGELRAVSWPDEQPQPTCRDTFGCDDGCRCGGGKRFVCALPAGHALHAGNGHNWLKDHSRSWPDGEQAQDERDADKPWILRLVCCGSDDGAVHFATQAEAELFRSGYTDGSGHDRQAILSGPGVPNRDPGDVLAEYLDVIAKGSGLRQVAEDAQTLLRALLDEREQLVADKAELTASFANVLLVAARQGGEIATLIDGYMPDWRKHVAARNAETGSEAAK